MFPGRRHAGRIFHNEVRLSGQVPQLCVLFGPSAAGGAYIPAFCDAVIMVEGNASMYLGSPRMAEVVVGERITLEEMGGARMHCSVSGCGDVLVKDEDAALRTARDYMAYMPSNWREAPAPAPPLPPLATAKPIDEVIPLEPARGYDALEVIRALVDEGSLLEIKRLFARELITGFARIDGRAVGVVASQPRFKGGVLFVDSADKGARFVSLCDAFNIPLLWLADVPGFMIGSAVERQGIIRHGAKMIAALSVATVPKVCVVLRKSYGAGLYAMCGPAFEPDCTIALPSAQIAVMGPEAAVNAVYYNKIQELPEDERAAYVQRLQDEYRSPASSSSMPSSPRRGCATSWSPGWRPTPRGGAPRSPGTTASSRCDRGHRRRTAAGMARRRDAPGRGGAAGAVVDPRPAAAQPAALRARLRDRVHRRRGPRRRRLEHRGGVDHAVRRPRAGGRLD